MSSAIGPAFSYLLANLPAIVAAVDPNGVVVDGPIATTIPPPPAPMLYVGATDPMNTTAETGAHLYVTLGGFHVDEDFEIPCFIDVSTGGLDQSQSRNTALAVLDGVVHLIGNDLTLGGILLAGRVAEITHIQMVQTDGPAESIEGRRCVVAFIVHCANHYRP